PLLPAHAVAVVQLDLGPDGGAVPVDVQASAQGGQRVVRVVGPVLVDRAGLAVPQVHVGQVDPAVVADTVDALPAGTGDRAVRCSVAVGGAGVAGRHDAGLDRVVGRVGRE